MPFPRPTVFTTELSDERGGGMRLLRQMQNTPIVTLPANPPYSDDRVLEFARGTARRRRRVFVVATGPDGASARPALVTPTSSDASRIRTAHRPFGRRARNRLTGMAARAIATAGDDWTSGVMTLGDLLGAVDERYGPDPTTASLASAVFLTPERALRARGVICEILRPAVTLEVGLGEEPGRIDVLSPTREIWAFAGTFVDVRRNGAWTALTVMTGPATVVDLIPATLDTSRSVTIRTPVGRRWKPVVAAAVKALLGFGPSDDAAA
jgi:hypothetical protein